MEHADDHQAIKRAYEDFVQLSTIDVIVPRSKEIKASALLKKQTDELHRTPSRSTIFFDEVTSVCVVLRTSASPSAIEVLLPHLELTTSAYATNAAEGAANATSVTSKHEITVVRNAAAEGASTVKVGTATHIAWSQSLHVRRPRARLQRPAVYFTATLSFKADYLEQASRAEKHFLPSFQPLPSNVLESFSSRSGRDDDKVYLSEARITKVAPPSPRTDGLRALRGATKRAFPAVPAVIPRLRCTAISGSVFVSLQIEASQILSGDVTLHDVSFEVSEADIDRIGESFESSTLQAGDEIALVYKIMEKRSLEKSGPPGLTSIAIRATAHLEQGTEVELSLSWQTQIELSKENPTKYCSWSGETRPGSAAQQSVPRVRDNSQSAGTLIFDFSAPKRVSMSAGFCDVSIRCVNRSQSIRQLAIRTNAEAPSLLRNAMTTTPDIRLGPVGSGECFEAVVKYQILAPGVLNLGQMWIVDLDSGESIRVQDLPDVVAHE
ncbi:hypothetical protein AMS68_007758 [Peltaster fructicola]|uniref:Trafficking protein particle complex II-specific subunit 65 IgD3 domain-containing protein n=1 Tax=Peltaster fructicola TaxID=286661 RepID=A0A6H0Y5N7_9PEZI|nr:hypothetical protein AMS68_007758 [Peltaster fructicola]